MLTTGHPITGWMIVHLFYAEKLDVIPAVGWQGGRQWPVVPRIKGNNYYGKLEAIELKVFCLKIKIISTRKTNVDLKQIIIHVIQVRTFYLFEF